MTIERTNSENIKITNVMYTIPHRRLYIIPEKRTEKEQKMFDAVNFTFKKMEKL